jgi:ABC-type lipoprotein export system ATPase subunit
MSSPVNTPLEQLLASRPWLADFFGAHGIEPAAHPKATFQEIVASLRASFFAELGTGREQLIADFSSFVAQMEGLTSSAQNRLASVRVLPGRDKSGVPEPMGVTLRSGQVTAVVGPTGSGKSRLLEDIECLAQRDTPTLRTVLVDERSPTDEDRFAAEGRMVAQLSQSMSFVMDLTVEDFLTMHAESRLVQDIRGTVDRIYEQANALAGEPFPRTQPVTGLSGGQSRALMIADTALLSAAPIVLIDEIENAGIDKVRALGLLVSAEKIVLISTHDPLLALSADQRLVIQNGAIRNVLATTPEEREELTDLRRMDAVFADVRMRLRRGDRIVRSRG